MTMFGQYELLRRLGAGGTAEVFLASGPNPAGDELLAVKIILAHLSEDARLKETLLHEARAASRVHHRNVVRTYEVGEAEGRPYLAMEYVRGWPLNVFLKRLKEKEQALTIPEVCSIVREAALGLHAAHEATDNAGAPLGLVHRDVSPHNLILREDSRVKVVDFGLAKATLANATQTGGLKGKIAYMPPEQIQTKALDRRADVFALGAVLWELLAGEKLHPGKTEAEILQQALLNPQRSLDRLAPGLPSELLALVNNAIERDVTQRLPTAQALADGLEPFIHSDTPQRLTHRLHTLFDPLPRTVAEAKGEVAPRRAERPPASPQPRTHERKSVRLDERTVPTPAVDPHPSGRKPSARSGERAAPAITEEVPNPTHHRPGGSGERGIPLGASEISPSGRRHTRLQAERSERESAESGAGSRKPAKRSADATAIAPNPLAEEYLREQQQERTQKVPVSADMVEEVEHTANDPRPGGLGSNRVVRALIGTAVATVLVGAAIAIAVRLAKSDAPPVPMLVPDEDSTPAAAPGAAQPVKAEAKPGTARQGKATLTVRSKVPAVVREGSRELGRTPLTVSLPAGTHLLQVTAVDGKGHRALSVTLQPGDKRVEDVALP